MTDTKEPHHPNHAQQGAEFKPVNPQDATRKEELNRIRGMQDTIDPERGPTNHTTNPSG